eukprot:sb/3475899/
MPVAVHISVLVDFPIDTLHTPRHPHALISLLGFRVWTCKEGADIVLALRTVTYHVNALTTVLVSLAPYLKEMKIGSYQCSDMQRHISRQSIGLTLSTFLSNKFCTRKPGLEHLNWPDSDNDS